MLDKLQPDLKPRISHRQETLKPGKRCVQSKPDLLPSVSRSASFRGEQIKDAMEDDSRLRTSRFDQAIERMRIALMIAREKSDPDFIDKAIEEINLQARKAVQCDSQNRSYKQILELVGTSLQELDQLPDLFYLTVRVVPSEQGWEPRELKKKDGIVDLEEDVLEIRDKPPVQIVYTQPSNKPGCVKILYRKNDPYGQPYIRFLDDSHQQEVEIDGAPHQVMKKGMTAKMTRLAEWDRGWVYYPCACDGRFNPSLPWFGSCRTGLLSEPPAVCRTEVVKEVLVKHFVCSAEKDYS